MHWRLLLLATLLFGCETTADCPAAQDVPSVAGDATWDPSLEDIVGFDHGEAWLSPIFVYGISGAVPVCVLLWLFGGAVRLAHQRRLARRSSKAARAAALKAGSVGLHGTVVSDSDEPPVRLEIRQRGENLSKNGEPWTRWSETSRELTVHPFVLKTKAGDVHVEPGGELLLADDLEVQPPEGKGRACIATVHPGDEAYVIGRLVAPVEGSGVYRGQSRPWTLRPPERGALVISTRPLTEAYHGRLMTRVTAVVVIAMLIVVAQLVASPYHLAVLRGANVPAVVVGECRAVMKDKAKTVERYIAIELLEGRQRKTIRIEKADVERTPLGTVVPANVVEINGAPRITLGVGASPLVGTVLPPMLLVLIGAFMVAGWSYRVRPWWEEKQIHHEEGGEAPTVDAS